MIECLVFDMDDTLYPEREHVQPRLAAVARRMAEAFGPKIAYDQALLACWESARHEGLFDTVLAQAGVTPEKAFIRELVALYRGLPTTLAPYPDVEESLRLWSHYLPLALVTDGHGPTQRAKLEALGLGRYFREVVMTDELGPGGAKPSVAAFQRVRERIGFTGPAVYVGDNPPVDFPGPKALGWQTVRLVRPGGRFAAVVPDAACRPDRVMHSLDELETLEGLTEYLAGNPT